MKIVPKDHRPDYDTFRKEALFLKTLRHPGIPLVYTIVEEDQTNSYLIEEYLEGRIFIRPGGNAWAVCR